MEHMITRAFFCLALAGPVALAAQTVTVPPNLILPNYDRIPVGQREGIEAGAYLARTNDAAANWYNPAGLAKSVKSSLNASATAYEWTSMSLEGFGVSEGRSRISSVGTLLGVVIGEDVLHSDHVRLGFAITRPIVWQPSSIELSFPLQSGQELIAYSTNVSFDVMVPSLSVAYAPGGVASGRVRLGAGLGVALTTRISGTSRLASVNSNWTPVQLSDFTFADPEVPLDYRLPLELAAGGALQFAKGQIELDVHYYGALDPYVLYESALTGRLTVVDNGGAPVVTTPPFGTTMNSARAVTNIALGGSYPLSGKFRFHAGFSTDRSPVADQTQSLFRQVDLSRVTAGISLTGLRLSGSLGFGYSFGSGTRQTLGSTLGGQQTETRLSVKSANLLFALSYGVGSQP